MMFQTSPGPPAANPRSAPPTNVFKTAARGMVINGVLWMLNLTVAEHVHNIEFGASVAISNSLLLIGAIWLLIIGVGHYQARGELVPEGSAG